jgi:hypothetical protein
MKHIFYPRKEQENAGNVQVFKVQKKLFKVDKIYIRQSTIQKIQFLCLANGGLDSWHELYLNCIVDGLDALIALDSRGRNKQ